MSHQDSNHGTTNAQDLQAAFEYLLPLDVFTGIKFRGESSWTPRTLVLAALLWCCSGKATLTQRFEEARGIVGLNDRSGKQPGTSYSGFLKRLAYWSNQLSERVVAEFRRKMVTELREVCLVAGRLLLAGDGSRSATPRTRSNENRFAGRKKEKKKASSKKRTKQKHKSQTQEDCDKKASSPQIWITVLYQVTLGLPWDWRSGPSNSSERDHLSEMAKDLPDNALVTLDAGFIGYDFWQGLNEANVDFVIRVGGNVKLLKNLGYVRTRGDLVYAWPDAIQRKKQPPMVLRLQHFSGGREEVYVVTNVLDHDRLSTTDLKEVYTARWGVEVYYRDFKQTFERGKLRSKKAENAELELVWSILALWAMALYTAVTQWANGIPPGRRSVAGMLRAFRLPMEQARCPAAEGKDIHTLILLAVKDQYERKSSKASRSHPRKKKKQGIGIPIIQEATKEQQDQAQQLSADATTTDTAA